MTRILHVLDHSLPAHSGYTFRTRALMKAQAAKGWDVAGVTGVHDLHLWSVAGDDASLTAHVALADEGKAETTRRALTEMLEERFKIHHATIQTETEPCGDEESLHR